MITRARGDDLTSPHAYNPDSRSTVRVPAVHVRYDALSPESPAAVVAADPPWRHVALSCTT
jgi:hypothetical protein